METLTQRSLRRHFILSSTSSSQLFIHIDDVTTASDGSATTGARCPSCPNEGKRSCSTCKNVKYCSTECQQADWPTHRVLCSTFKDFQERPSEDMRRIIYFPPYGEKPEFMWRSIRDTNSYQRLPVDVNGLMDDQIMFPRVILDNLMINKPLHHKIIMNYDENFDNNYSQPSMAMILATDAKLDFLWRGPLIAVCGHGWGYESLSTVKDMDMGSFSDLVADIKNYYNSTKEHKARKGPKVQAVIAACQGEQRVHGKPAFRKVMVPRHHPIFEKDCATSMIAEKVGIGALKTYKYRTNDPALTNVRDKCNPPFTFMLCNFDPNTTNEEK